MGKKFNHLNIPSHWEHYWTKYPEGYTILEALLNWVAQVDNMVDNVNNLNEYLDDFVATFDENLQGKVVSTLSEWQDSGFLDVVIDEALQTQMDVLEQETQEKLNQFSTELAQTAEELAQTAEELRFRGKNLLPETNLLLDYIQSRSSVYDFSIVETPIKGDGFSFKVTANNYEGSQDSNKDFAIVMNEVMTSSDRIKVEFWVMTDTDRTIRVGMAYDTKHPIFITGNNKWHKIKTELDLSSMSRRNKYLYFDLRTSGTVYFRDLHVEYIVDKEPPVSLADVSEKISDNVLTIQNSDGSINALLNNAQTYLEHIEKFVYGNSYTAYDEIVELVNDKFQIDCSSFVSLLMRGIPFSKSRYNIDENIDSPYFFTNIDSYKYRTANQMAKYLHDKNFTFKPNDDFSNLQPGDIVFFSWNTSGNTDIDDDFKKYAFMHIQHVGIFLKKKNENRFLLVQLDNGFTTVYYEATLNYMSQCVLAARVPFANISEPKKDNLIILGDKEVEAEGVTDIKTYRLTRPLKKGKYYTLNINGQLKENCYFVIRSGGHTLYSDYGKQGSYDNVTQLHFPVLVDVPRELTVSIGGSIPNEERGGTLKWVSLYEGFIRKEENYQTNEVVIDDFPIYPSLANDLQVDSAPYYKYFIEKNLVYFNLFLPFDTLRTGNLEIANMYFLELSQTQRLPLNLLGENGEAVNGVLQVSKNGLITIIPYDPMQKWKWAMANGYVFRG